MKQLIMPLKEVKSRILKLENSLELELTLKKINFEKTQPRSSKIQSVLVSKSSKIFDKFTHYVIKDVEMDNKILLLQKELLSYEKYYFDEIARMLKYEDITLIIYLREEEKLSWKQIDSILNNGTDYSRKKYEAYKKEAKR